MFGIGSEVYIEFIIWIDTISYNNLNNLNRYNMPYILGFATLFSSSLCLNSSFFNFLLNEPIFIAVDLRMSLVIHNFFLFYEKLSVEGPRSLLVQSRAQLPSQYFPVVQILYLCWFFFYFLKVTRQSSLLFLEVLGWFTIIKN